MHGATGPYDPPTFVSRRVRDVIDLLLLRSLSRALAIPVMTAAVVDVFKSRAKEARLLRRPERALPAKVVAYSHWEADYAEAASGASIEIPMGEAID